MLRQMEERKKKKKTIINKNKSPGHIPRNNANKRESKQMGPGSAKKKEIYVIYIYVTHRHTHTHVDQHTQTFGSHLVHPIFFLFLSSPRHSAAITIKCVRLHKTSGPGVYEFMCACMHVCVRECELVCAAPVHSARVGPESGVISIPADEGGFWPCSRGNGGARLSDKTFLMPKEPPLTTHLKDNGPEGKGRKKMEIIINI